jgi:hypothetical protein
MIYLSHPFPEIFKAVLPLLVIAPLAATHDIPLYVSFRVVQAVDSIIRIGTVEAFALTHRRRRRTTIKAVPLEQSFTLPGRKIKR